MLRKIRATKAAHTIPGGRGSVLGTHEFDRANLLARGCLPQPRLRAAFKYQTVCVLIGKGHVCRAVVRRTLLVRDTEQKKMRRVGVDQILDEHFLLLPPGGLIGMSPCVLHASFFSHRPTP
jgi:hypothetical protein